MTDVLHRNDKFLTFYNKFSKIVPSTSVHFVTRERKSRVVRLELIFAFLYAGSSIQNTSEQFVSCIHLSF
jgi:hypothetical protein